MFSLTSWGVGQPSSRMDRSCLKRLVLRYLASCSDHILNWKLIGIPKIAGYPKDLRCKQEEDGYCDSWVGISLVFEHLTLACLIKKATHRCSYRTSGSSLVIHGRVTDFQMWDKVLPDSQLKQVPANIT